MYRLSLQLASLLVYIKLYNMDMMDSLIFTECITFLAILKMSN